VVVAVTWPESQCAANVCSYVTSTLVSAVTTDPIYNEQEFLNPPVINTPTNQSSTVNVAVTPLTLSATGGTPPLTWSVPSVPTGLSASLSGIISGTPTVTGNTTMPITVTDAVGRSSSVSIVWTVNAGPSLTNPGAQSSTRGTAIPSTTLTVTNGTAPYAWQATGLPAGLSIDPSSGAITGTPTGTGTSSVTVRVTDRYNATTTSTFNWTVNNILVITNATPEITTMTVNRTMTRTGGTGTVAWSAVDLPPGITLNSSTGVLSGTHAAGTRYLTTITVTDQRGATATATVELDVQGLPALGNRPRVTFPNGNQNYPRNTYVSVQLVADGGAGFAWSATGLPPGITLTPGGVLSGTATTPGTYRVTLNVRNNGGFTAVYMFDGTIT